MGYVKNEAVVGTALREGIIQRDEACQMYCLLDGMDQENGGGGYVNADNVLSGLLSKKNECINVDRFRAEKIAGLAQKLAQKAEEESNRPLYITALQVAANILFPVACDGSGAEYYPFYPCDCYKMVCYSKLDEEKNVEYSNCGCPPHLQFDEYDSCECPYGEEVSDWYTDSEGREVLACYDPTFDDYNYGGKW